MTVEQTVPFRDKERMKQVLDAAGIRTPRHVARHDGRGGAGRRPNGSAIPSSSSRSTGPARPTPTGSIRRPSSTRSCPMIRHVPEVSVEEFIEAEEFTYDTICAGGNVLFENICWYRPRPLHDADARVDQPGHRWRCATSTCPACRAAASWVAPCCGRSGFTDGFTHMEWYRKADGEVVFGEIGARPPGARTVDVMNYATDADLFAGWARGGHAREHPVPDRAALQRRLHLQAGPGGGPDHRNEGLDRLLAEYGDHVASGRPAPGRRAAPRLAGHPDRGRHGDRPPPRAAPGHRRWPTASPPTSTCSRAESRA